LRILETIYKKATKNLWTGYENTYDSQEAVLGQFYEKVIDNDDVVSSDVNIDVNKNSLRDVRTWTFWRPRPQILHPRPQESDLVNKRAGPRPHMSVNGVRDMDIKYSSTDEWRGASWWSGRRQDEQI